MPASVRHRDVQIAARDLRERNSPGPGAPTYNPSQDALSSSFCGRGRMLIWLFEGAKIINVCSCTKWPFQPLGDRIVPGLWSELQQVLLAPCSHAGCFVPPDAFKGSTPPSYLYPPSNRAKKQPLWKNLYEVGRKKRSAESSLSKALQMVSFHIAESVNQGIAPQVLH